MAIADYLTNVATGGKSTAASGSMNAAINQLISTVPPDLQSLVPQLQKELLAGTITPAQAQSYLQQQSEAAGIQVPQATIDAQNAALQQLQGVATSGGMDATAKSQLLQIQNQQNNNAAAQRSANLSELQQRGIGGSGVELASMMGGTQAAATGAAAQGAQVAGDAQTRALQAMSQSGQLAGQMSDQSYQQQLQKAQAQDAINRFNSQLQSQQSATNAQAQNTAQAQNIQNAQGVNSTNTQIANTNAMMPYQAAQQTFTNQNAVNKNISDAYQAQSKLNQTQAAANANTTGGLLDWAGKNSGTIKDVAKAAMGYFSGSMGYSSDERLKHDKQELSSDDIDQLLDGLTGYKYKYTKDVDPSQKTHAGVMAQDLERHMPENVIDTPQGKIVVDNDNSRSAMMAALANVHKRVKDLEGKK